MGARTRQRTVNRPEPHDEVLASRLRQAREELARRAVPVDIYKELLPYVRWTRGEAVVEPPPPVVQRLTKVLGERFRPLKGIPERPADDELAKEAARQRRKGVPDEIATAVAEMEFMRRSMRSQLRDPFLERESPAWEAVTAAAVAAAALLDGSPQALACADEYFDRLDTARIATRKLKKREKQAAESVRRQSREQARKRSSKGGSAEKKLGGVAAWIRSILAAEPDLKPGDIWERIPAAEGLEAGLDVEGGYSIYRIESDGEEKIEQVVRILGKERSDLLRKSSFYRYVADIRKEKIRGK